MVYIILIWLIAYGWWWTAAGLILFYILMARWDAIAANEHDERNRKYEEERFARLYPEEYKKEQIRLENMRLEWKKAEEKASQDELDRIKKEIRDFEEYCL